MRTWIRTLFIGIAMAGLALAGPTALTGCEEGNEVEEAAEETGEAVGKTVEEAREEIKDEVEGIEENN